MFTSAVTSGRNIVIGVLDLHHNGHITLDAGTETTLRTIVRLSRDAACICEIRTAALLCSNLSASVSLLNNSMNIASLLLSGAIDDEEVNL